MQTATRIASLLLGQGVPLSEVSPAVENLVTAAGVPACLKALSAPEPKDRLQALQLLGEQVNKPLPKGDAGVDKAALRLQKAVRRRKLQEQSAVAASDFRITEGIWRGMDEEPVGILDQVEAHTSGVVMLDPCDASPEAMARYKSLDAEVLCIIVPGHACPDPPTCSGTVSVPVKHRATGASHLLAACYHNVGQTDAEPFFGDEAKVEVAGMICCSFTMYREYTTQEEWVQACRAPVRTVIDAFRSSGVVNAIQHPWGRSFRLGTRPAVAEKSDSFQFHGKVPEASLQPLLQVSGYNRVFMVPKTWTRTPLSGWQIVWVSTPLPDLEKSARLLPEQSGLVRGRNRLGVRVRESHFASAFRQLRPQEDVPVKVEVAGMYKVGPVPPRASAEAVQKWAATWGWGIKVFKMLGPSHWMVGASAPPQTDVREFEGSPVLIVPIIHKAPVPPVIQAGGAPPLRRKESSQGRGADPWDSGDPWSAYKSQTPAAQGSQPRATNVTCPPHDPQMHTRLATHDARLEELERSIHVLQADQKKAQAERASDRAQTGHEFEKVRGELQGLGQSLGAQFQTSLDSLRLAQQQQEQQLSSQFADLRSLILAGAERKARKQDHDL